MPWGLVCVGWGSWTGQGCAGEFVSGGAGWSVRVCRGVWVQVGQSGMFRGVWVQVGQSGVFRGVCWVQVGQSGMFRSVCWIQVGQVGQGCSGAFSGFQL